MFVGVYATFMQVLKEGVGPLKLKSRLKVALISDYKRLEGSLTAQPFSKVTLVSSSTCPQSL